MQRVMMMMILAKHSCLIKSHLLEIKAVVAGSKKFFFVECVAHKQQNNIKFGII